jgi:hypothetical protein
MNSIYLRDSVGVIYACLWSTGTQNVHTLRIMNTSMSDPGESSLDHLESRPKVQFFLADPLYN